MTTGFFSWAGAGETVNAPSRSASEPKRSMGRPPWRQRDGAKDGGSLRDGAQKKRRHARRPPPSVLLMWGRVGAWCEIRTIAGAGQIAAVGRQSGVRGRAIHHPMVSTPPPWCRQPAWHRHPSAGVVPPHLCYKRGTPAGGKLARDFFPFIDAAIITLAPQRGSRNMTK